METVWRFGELGDHWPFFGFVACCTLNSHKAAGDPGNLSNSQCPTVLSPAKPFDTECHRMSQVLPVESLKLCKGRLYAVQICAVGRRKVCKVCKRHRYLKMFAELCRHSDSITRHNKRSIASIGND